MSALAGLLNWSSAHRPETSCRSMVAALENYGPDGSGLWANEDIAFGHALHACLPEDGIEHQPLLSQDDRFVIIADIRLDNRADLISRLGLEGTSTACGSDAVILLRAFERWHLGCLDFVNGDYALAIGDTHERKLFLIRDALGQRPLYYHQGAGFFAFASMPAGLHAIPGVVRRPHMARLADFVGFVPHEGSDGFYEGIERVEPGHVVTITRSGLSSRRHWMPDLAKTQARSFGECKEAFRAELDRSVRVRMRGAGNRIATHLSGGWDSSAVTATAARLSGSERGAVRAYTSVPRPGNSTSGGTRYFADESDLAAATAARYPNVQHVLIPGARKSPVAGLDRYVSAYDRPVYNLSNQVWISDIRDDAREAGLKVLMTGEFGNYSISSAPFTVLADYLRQGRWLDWLREARALAGGRHARYRGIAANSFAPWLPTGLWNAVRPLSSRPEAALATALHPDLAAAVDTRRERAGVGLAARPRNYRQAILDALSGLDHGDTRAGALAGWGIDERDPTADRQLVEFCLSLPIDMILKGGQRRPLARAALSDRLPAAVLNERRKGQQASDWHEGLTSSRAELSGLLEDIASNDLASSLLDIESLKSWLADWPEGGWDDPVVISRYRRALPIALTAGHFILHASR